MTVLEARANALSDLQNLGRPLSRIQAPAPPLPYESSIPGLLDMSLDAEPTRAKKCCQHVPATDRFSSEWYPIEAPKDLRFNVQVFGAPSRLDGRDPAVYRR